MTQQQKLFVAVLAILFSLSPAAHGAAGFQTARGLSRWHKSQGRDSRRF